MTISANPAAAHEYDYCRVAFNPGPLWNIYSVRANWSLLTDACIDEQAYAALDEGFLTEAEVPDGLQQLLPEAGLLWFCVDICRQLQVCWSRRSCQHKESTALLPPIGCESA